MADFYKQRDVHELLKSRKILFIGDSNVRPLYKDLLGALTQKRLTSADILKNPNVDSYFGDIAIQQCGRKNSWSFWENRIYEEGGCRVEMFSTGEILVDVIKGFFQKLAGKSSSVPDIVYLSYGPTHWKNNRHSLFDLLVALKFTLPFNTVFIVGSGFPTTTDSFGDPIFDDVPYFTKCSMMNEEQNNMTIVDKTSSLGFIFLNFAFYLRKSVFRGVAAQPGWESVVVRYTTFLLLTCIAQNLLEKVPGRVDQELFTKAMVSTREDLEEYRLLLLKLSNSWIDVKSKLPVDEQADPAAKNAKEILEKLWKLYRSRDHCRKSRADKKSRCSKSSKRHKAMTDRQLSNIVSKILPKPTGIYISDPGSVAVASRDDPKNEAARNETVQTVRVQGECDAESLEEGELRDSPCTSRSRSPSAGFETCILLSDVSSSEGVMDDEGDAEPVAPGTTTPEIQLHRRELPSRVGESIVGRSLRNLQIQNTLQSTCLGQAVGPRSTSYNHSNPFTIEVSDEETPADGGEESATTYQSQEDVMIYLDSGDSDVETVILPGKEVKVISNNNPSEIAINNSCHPSSTSQFKKHEQLVLESENMNADLYLKDKNGDSVSWPTDFSILKADLLWKWWRTHIDGSNESIIIYPKDWPQLHARIPTLFTKGNVAVPKVIDDIKLFLQSLRDIQFSEGCLVDCSYNIVDDVDDDENAQAVEPLPSAKNTQAVEPLPSAKNTQAVEPLPSAKNTQAVEPLPSAKNTQAVEPLPSAKNTQSVEPLPSATVLSGGREKRVHFQIPPRGTLKSSLPACRISVRSFASYRHLLSRQSVTPGALETTTEQPTTSSAEDQPPSWSSTSNFYAYGEHMDLSKAASYTQHWDPLCSWVPTPSKSTIHSPGSHLVNTGGLPENLKKPVDDHKRKRDRSRSTSPPVRDYSSSRRSSKPRSHPHKRIIIDRRPDLKKSKTSEKR